MVAALLAVILSPGLSAANLLADGPEFQVNTQTSLTQRSMRAVARADTGDFVVVWQTYAAEDGSGRSVQAQRFDAAGTPAGTQFRVNSYTTADQNYPEVSAAPDGSFVVVWTAGGGQDGSIAGVQGQRFDSAGVAIGPEFQANAYTTGIQQQPALSVADDGSFVVVWIDNARDGSDLGIFGRRFDNAGAPSGTEFQINTYTTGAQRGPGVAVASDGSFMATWESSPQDGDNFGVFARRYDAAGVPSGTEFQVNSYTTGRQRYAAVTATADGGFVVVWSGATQDASADGIGGQRFNGSGSAVGTQFQINAYTTSDQYFPAIAASADGSFLVSWASDGSDGDGFGIGAQLFDATAVAVGTELQVNSYTTSYQWITSVGADASGNFVVTWSSYEQDGSDLGIFAQRYCKDADNDLACDGSFAPEMVDEPVGAGGTVTTDPEADGATPSDPIESAVTSPNAGNVSILETVISTSPAVLQIDITAPPASVADPLVLVFRVDATLATSFTVLKNGAPLAAQCAGAPGTASPDPCVDSVVALPDGDALLTIYTSTASQWQLQAGFGCPSSPEIACIEAAQAKLDYNETKAGAEKMKMQWKKLATATTQNGFGDPVGGTTAVALCIYDDANELVQELLVNRAAELCAGKPCWAAKGAGGLAYGDKDNATAGISKIGYKAGDAGKGKTDAKGKNNAAKAQVALPTGVAALLSGNSAPTIQMLTSDAFCATATMAEVKKDDGSRYAAQLK